MIIIYAKSSASNQTGSKYTLIRTAYFSCGIKSKYCNVCEILGTVVNYQKEEASRLFGRETKFKIKAKAFFPNK